MGKSIRIYLADQQVGGIRHAEIVNWTGQALAFPRNQAANLKTWPEVARQGVYFLFGLDDETGQDAVYIGETELVAERIAQHLANKEFWVEGIAFTSKDENLTKAHVKYLESKLVAAAIKADRYHVLNSSSPTASALPRADSDAMDEFAENIRMLLGVLGHRVLDPALSTGTRSVATSAELGGVQMVAVGTSSPPKPDSSALFLAIGDVEARAVRDTDSLVVLSESQASRKTAESLSEGYRAVREKLINTGVLVNNGAKLRFAKDYPFPSSSQAAAVILGYMINGRQAWKTADGRTLKELEEVEAQSLSVVQAPTGLPQ